MQPELNPVPGNSGKWCKIWISELHCSRGKVAEIVVHQLPATISWWLFEGKWYTLIPWHFQPSMSMDRAGSGNQRKSRIKEMQVLKVVNLAAYTDKSWGNAGLTLTAFIRHFCVLFHIAHDPSWNSSFTWILEYTTPLLFCPLLLPLPPFLLHRLLGLFSYA